MKFVVTKHPYNNDVEVRLHDDTKDKIKKVLYWFTVASGSVATVVLIRRDHKRTEEEKLPTE